MATHNLSWLDKFPGRVFRCDNENLLELKNSKQITAEIEMEKNGEIAESNEDVELISEEKEN